MRRSLTRVALLAGGAAAVAGCSAPPPPEVTFFADGESVRAEPLQYCDTLLTSCEPDPGEPAVLDVRPGEQVQVSVPADIAETPWVVNIQYADADGTVRPVRQETFTDRTRHAYTAVPANADEQLLVVEVQQLSAAYAADEQGEVIVDENGEPQLVPRAHAIWSLHIDPRERS